MKQILSSLLSSLLFLSALRSSYAADIDIVRERRFSGIVGATTGATSISSWYVKHAVPLAYPEVTF